MGSNLIKLDQIGLNWIKLDNIGSNLITLDQTWSICWNKPPPLPYPLPFHLWLLKTWLKLVILENLQACFSKFFFHVSKNLKTPWPCIIDFFSGTFWWPLSSTFEAVLNAFSPLVYGTWYTYVRQPRRLRGQHCWNQP
mgnify:CR=1 FL=1